jgi:hypothetical protein
MKLQRLLLAAVACAAIVPLAIWLSATLDQERAEPLLELRGPDYSERLDRAERLLRRAARHTPSAEPELKLARALVFGSQDRRAAAVLEPVTRREPENYDAWTLLAIALERSDPAASRRARARARELSPPVPPP